jgi:hypothetical protein
VGPHAREREGRTTLTSQRKGGLDRGPADGEPRGGSPLLDRFYDGEVVAKHGRVMGVMGWGELDRRWPLAAGPRHGGGCPRR